MRKPKLVCRNHSGKLLGIYSSTREAANDLLVDEDGIEKALAAKSFQKSGENFFFWSKEMIDATANLYKDTRGQHRHHGSSVPVVQINLKTGEIVNEYFSMYEALRQTGISTIARVCKGLAKTAGGYGWMFKKEYDELQSENSNDNNNNNTDIDADIDNRNALEELW